MGKTFRKLNTEFNKPAPKAINDQSTELVLCESCNKVWDTESPCLDCDMDND